MANSKTRWLCPGMGLVLMAGWVMSAGLSGEQLPVPAGIEVRDGFKLSVAAEGIERARFMALGEDGRTVYVSQPHLGVILTLTDGDGDGFYEKRTEFTRGHNTVHGLCRQDGWLWFTQSDAIFKARDTNQDGVADEEVAVIATGQLPSGGGHWWRSILVHKDRFYTSIGDSGNANDETATERQKIWSFALDGTGRKLFASGLRNTEKLVVRPGTNEIWGMDHGSDRFGYRFEGNRPEPGKQPITDLNPPCEMNHYVEGGFYGHPFVVGNRLVRYEYMDKPDILELAEKTIPPAWCAGAHWAPNAMEFYNGSQFPTEYLGDALVAYHGSWNRSEKAGYCVDRVLFEKGKPYGELKLVSFLSPKSEVLGRPVDVRVAGDGSVLVSDDFGNRIYRLEWVAEKPAGQTKTKDDPAGTTGQQPEAASKEWSSIRLGPVSTFEVSCARCHGPAGAFYGAEFAQLQGEKLRGMVKDMMEGPAFLKPTTLEIAAMTAYQTALAAKVPFVTVLECQSDELGAVKRLTGEASLKSQITISSPGQNEPLLIQPDDRGHWNGQPQGMRLPLTISAIKSNRNVIMEFPRQHWSETKQ